MSCPKLHVGPLAPTVTSAQSQRSRKPCSAYVMAPQDVHQYLEDSHMPLFTYTRSMLLLRSCYEAAVRHKFGKSSTLHLSKLAAAMLT